MRRRWWILGGLVWCLVVVACTEPGPDGDGEPAPPGDPLTGEEYRAASHEACEHYLGALFALAEADDELDTAREDASQQLFVRRADDIASLYGDYRAQIAALEPPEDEDLTDAHRRIVELMDEHREATGRVGEAHGQGDDEQDARLLAETRRTQDELAAVQEGIGIRPCGR